MMDKFNDAAATAALIGTFIFAVNLILGVHIANIFKTLLRMLNITKNSSGVEKHIKRLIGAAGKNEDKAYIFYFSTVFIFIISALLLLRQGFDIKGLIIAVILATLPYAYLWLRMMKRRTKTSYEGEFLIAELTSQYKICCFNMAEAIEQSISHLDHAPLSQQQLFKMSLRLKKHKSDDELREIMQDFTYGINTQWSKMLSNNIYIAIADGIKVTAGMEDALKECKIISESIEEGKRKNAEPSAIVMYMSPAIYFGLFYAASKLIDITPKDIMIYQFNTPNGLTLIIAIIIVAFVNYAIMVLFGHKKYDM